MQILKHTWTLIQPKIYSSLIVGGGGETDAEAIQPVKQNHATPPPSPILMHIFLL